MSVPLVPLDAMPTAGLEVPVGPWGVAAGRDVAAGLRDLGGRVFLLRRGPHVLARGEVSWTDERPCDRCGETLVVPGGGAFACVYSPTSALPVRAEDAEGGPEVPEVFAGEADEVGEYEGDALDLAQVLREFVALERPPRLLCADLDAAQDEACLGRWRGRSGTEGAAAQASPFQALRGVRVAPLSPHESDKP